MFAQLKESKLFKSLSGAFCAERKRCAKEGAATGSGETKKTDEVRNSNKPKSEITIS